jgi:sulfide dehydrogenase [flavocytochrome c] flavoprotein chain
MMHATRRTFLAAAASTALTLPTILRAASNARVVVIGGGFGGAALARYLARHDPRLAITVVERETKFVTCPFSNGVLGGLWPLSRVTFDYRRVRAAGVTVVHASAQAIDPAAKKISLSNGDSLEYDYLVLSPGIQFIWNQIRGYDQQAAQVMPHAWIAGAQTQLLRKQLMAMRDGGLVVIGVPKTPFRCPPGPYERAALIAHYLKANKPKSKLLILDANDSFTKQPLFEQAWSRLYPGMIEWVAGSKSGAVMEVRPDTMTVSTGFDDHKVDVANIIPPQRAAEIAIALGLDQGRGFCAVDPMTFESKVHRGIYVLGDAAIAGEMPKSAFSANSQAKVCAAAILASIGAQATPRTKLINVCYSFAAPDYAFSIADVFEARGDTIAGMAKEGRTTALDASSEKLKREAQYAESWYSNITAETFG